MNRNVVGLNQREYPSFDGCSSVEWPPKGEQPGSFSASCQPQTEDFVQDAFHFTLMFCNNYIIFLMVSRIMLQNHTAKECAAFK